jgi:hypothetical protein
MNTVMFLWEYESVEERIAKRAALARDPDWLAIAEEAAGYLIEQQGDFFSPVHFLRRRHAYRSDYRQRAR